MNRGKCLGPGYVEGYGRGTIYQDLDSTVYLYFFINRKDSWHRVKRSQVVFLPSRPIGE